jgi:hypothetical protein
MLPMLLMDGRPPVTTLVPVAEVVPRALEPASTDGSLVRRIGAGFGVRIRAGPLDIWAEASDIGGDGGSSSSVVGSPSDLVISGGVVMRGELAAESTEASVFLSKVGEPRSEISDEMVEWRDSYFLILSCIISASILSSDSSSRNRCDSMRSASRSCSPIRISSSIKTPRSTAWLNFDSMSSSDDVVFRA